MKTRICLVLLAIIAMLPVSGCQEAATERAETWVPEKSAAAVSVAATASDVQPPTRFTTIRRRNPETGRIETVRVPVRTLAQPETQPAPPLMRSTSTARRTTSPAAEPQPAAAEPERTAARRAAAARAQAAAQSDTSPIPTRTTRTARTQPAALQEKKFEVSWDETCSVQKVFEVTNELLYERLGLKKVYHNSGGRRTPQEPAADYLSATLKARSTIDVVFYITISLTSPESCTIRIKATSTMQPEHVLEIHSLFLKDKISEAIHQSPEQVQAVEEGPPYPEMVVFDYPVEVIFKAVYGWAEEQEFDCGSSGRDKYFKVINCETGSGIRFRFTLHLVGPNKTKLEINISNYEGKDEFLMILKSLREALVGLKEG